MITFRSAEAIRKAVASYPLERILLETDCPYLAPLPYRGQRNEPSYIPLIAAKVAEVKGLSQEEIARITYQNAQNFFGL